MGLFKKRKGKIPNGMWVKVDFTESAKETGLNHDSVLDIIRMRGDKEVYREPFNRVELDRIKKEEEIPVIISAKIPFVLEPSYLRYFGILKFFRFIQRDYKKNYRL